MTLISRRQSQYPGKKAPAMNRRDLLTALAGLTCLPIAGQAKGAEARQTNAELAKLPGGVWTKIHEQKRGDAVTFRRQPHAGSAFDSRRGRLVLFGSDTHGKDWSNSPLFFDLASLSWSRLYPDDPSSTYAVTAEGLPVAGPKGDHPWAMHTFGALGYDPGADQLIVASYPQHMKPGRFSNDLAHLWPQVRRHPTWVLHMDSGEWEPLPIEPVHLFPYCAAFDSDRGVLVGYAAYGVYELSGPPRQWTKVAAKGLTGYHNNAVYDSRNWTIVVFGSKENSNDIVVFEPTAGIHQKMPTPGLRPPKDQHAPMAYHAGLKQTAVLVDRREPNREQTETWSYDLEFDRWTVHPKATLPFPLGMNYTMEYDPQHDLLLLVAAPPQGMTAVWALKL